MWKHGLPKGWKYRRAPKGCCKYFEKGFLASAVTFLEGGSVYTCNAPVVTTTFLYDVPSEKSFLNNSSIVIVPRALSTAQGRWGKKCSLATEEQVVKVKGGILLLPIIPIPVPVVPAPMLALALGSAVSSPGWLPALSCAPVGGCLQGILLDRRSGKQREVV